MPSFLRFSLLTAAALGAGCVDDTDSTQQREDVSADDGECGCKIEGSDIGVSGARVEVGGQIILFSDWVAKADSPGEYVGFTLSSNAASIAYVVKAGNDLYPASGTTWAHPAGDSGPDASGISNVDFCEDDGGDGGDGSDGGDLPEVD